MKKRTLWIIMLVAIIVCVYILTFHFNIKVEKLTDVTFVSGQDIDKLELRNGTNGERAEITDKTKIKELMDFLDNVSVKRKYINASGGGWTYYIGYYSKDKVVGSITFNNPLYVNDKRYLVVGQNPSFEDVWRFIREYFKSSNLDWH